MTQTTLTSTPTEQKLTKCSLCGLDGIMMPVEFLPKAGVVIKVIHRRGNECRWARYGSFEELGIHPDRKRSPRVITCPKCGKEGIVNEYQPDKRRPEHIVYYVRHGKIQYGQGNSRKQDRHTITDEIQRDEVLKQIGRYIERPTIIDLSPKNITCPKCGTRGQLGSYHPDKRRRPDYVKYYVDHKEDRHIISDPEQKKTIENKLAKDQYDVPTLTPEPTQTQTQTLPLLLVPTRPKPTPTKQKSKQNKRQQGRIINCPQCHHRGVLNIADHKTGTFLVRHSWEAGGRHYLKKGEETELAERRYNR